METAQISNEIKGLATKFAEAQADVMKLFDKHEVEIKEMGMASGETREHLKKASETMVKIEAEMKSATERMDEFEKKIKDPGGHIGERKLMTPGQLVVESDQYKNNDGRSMKAVEMKSLFETKDVSGIVADGGYAVHDMRVPELFYDPGQRPSHIRDVMNIGQTASNAITFVRETLFTNNAANAPEKGEYGKPQSDFTFEEFSAPVATIAHWVPATRQILSDKPTMLSYVGARLTYGVKVAEDNEILFGTGANSGITGVMVTPGVGAIGPVVTNQIDLLRNAIAQVRASEYPATAIILNPADWATIELSRGAVEGMYLWANPANSGPPRLWGLPIIETTAMPVGSFLVGAFGLGAQLWDREQASVRVSEHHEDYFTNNLVVILAEERLALTVYRPQAFVAGTF